MCMMLELGGGEEAVQQDSPVCSWDILPTGIKNTRERVDGTTARSGKDWAEQAVCWKQLPMEQISDNSAPTEEMLKKI